ncbi:AAA family ATPase [Micromonospora vinacea]|uniref:AAA family ATPase n=1 Tax=Micromonospora vinacea TaxID=709878 RepID=UPI0034562387
MTEGRPPIDLLPYSLIVGQEELRRALEIAYVGRLGVLATGQRGTAKSTTIRAFGQLVFKDLPVTMPIGVTDDRVLGGYSVDALLGDKPETKWQDGLIALAAKTGMLYVDEINLLDDHIVNLVLDPASTSILTVQRENADRDPEKHEFALVGSMNPDEGPLRPQLLDRFGLVVTVADAGERATRARILRVLLDYDRHRGDLESEFMVTARAEDAALAARLSDARDRCRKVVCDDTILEACASVATAFHVLGHRGELAMLRAAQACAALDGATEVTIEHCRRVAKPALLHRRPNVDSGTLRAWGPEEDQRVEAALAEWTD